MSRMGRGTWGRSATGLETLGDVQDKSEDLGEVREGSRDPRKGLGQVEGPTGRSGTGWGGVERVKRLSERSGTGRGTIGGVGDGLGDPG